MKIMFWDIETLPGQAYFFDARTDWIAPHQVIRPPCLLSYAAKFAGQRRIVSDILTPAEAVEHKDKRVVEGLSELFEDVDYAVAHNGDKFDMPQLTTFITFNALPPLRRPQTIDTLKIAKQSLRAVHNNLDSLAKSLGVPTKIKTTFDLWRQCDVGDELALRKMLRYNRQDVVVLEGVYERLRPYAKGLPRLVDPEFNGARVCLACGSDDVHKDGYYRALVGTYQRWRCQVCGHNMRDSSPLPTSQAPRAKTTRLAG